MRYWEDRVTDKQYNQIEDALTQLRKSDKKREAQLDCYDSLTDAGMTAEEADDMINAILEGAD